MSDRSPVLLIVDHASRAVPDGIDLGVDDSVFSTHIAIDLGVAELTRALAARLDAPAILAPFSRLVVDLNRGPDDAGAVPTHSDGVVIPGNATLSLADREQRIATFHAPYHAGITARLDAAPPRLIVGIHSFTPALASRVEPRPWPIGILYNRDDRAARHAIDLLRAQGIDAGDNQPYSGRVLNYTMDRHAEARGLPYLSVEVRQDELADDAGVERWAGLLAPVILACAGLV